MTLAAWLIAMVGPLVARVLASLGVSMISITGLVYAVQLIKDQMLGTLAGLPATSLQLAGLFGAWEAIGAVFGTMTFVITWRSMTGFIALAKAA